MGRAVQARVQQLWLAMASQATVGSVVGVQVTGVVLVQAWGTGRSGRNSPASATINPSITRTMARSNLPNIAVSAGKTPAIVTVGAVSNLPASTTVRMAKPDNVALLTINNTVTTVGAVSSSPAIATVVTAKVVNAVTLIINNVGTTAGVVNSSPVITTVSMAKVINAVTLIINNVVITVVVSNLLDTITVR